MDLYEPTDAEIAELKAELARERQLLEQEQAARAAYEEQLVSLIPGVSMPRSVARTVYPIVGSVGGSAGGALAGALAGAPFGPVGVVGGGLLGGYAGDILGTTAADVSVGNQIDLARREEEARYGAALGLGLGGLVKGGAALARFGKSKIYDPLVDAYRGYIGPQTEQAAETLVGKEIDRLTTAEELAAAQALRENAPLGSATQAMTTGQLTGNVRLQQAEQLMSQQPIAGANEEFATRAAQQIDAFNKNAEAVAGLQALEGNPKEAGKTIKTLLGAAEDSERKAASKAFQLDEVRKTTVPVGDLQTNVNELYAKYYKDTNVAAPEGDLNDLYNKVKELYAKKPEQKRPAFGFKEEKPTPPEVTVGTIQDLRSKLLEITRRGIKKDADQAFAGELARTLDGLIDNAEGVEKLDIARGKWRNYVQSWFFDDQGQMTPLRRILRTQAPEDVLTKYKTNSAFTDAVNSKLGAARPELVASDLNDFIAKPTAQAKLAWINDSKTRARLEGTPLWNIIDGWKNELEMITEATGGNVPRLAPSNLDVQAKAVVRALGGNPDIALSAGERAIEAQGTNLARSLGTSALRQAGPGLIGAGVGGYLGSQTGDPNAMYMGALTGAGLGLGANTAALSGLGTGAMSAIGKQRAIAGTELAGEALTRALLDPTEAARMAYLARNASVPVPYQIPVPGMQQVLPGAMAAGGAVNLGAGQRTFGAETPMPTPTPTPEPTPAPTPEPTTAPLMSDQPMEEDIETGAIGDFAPGELSDEMIELPSGETISIPSGEGYMDPALVKAVILIESGGRPNAVSKKGAKGMMQIMDATAKELGIDPTDPRQNIEGGSRYLQKMYDRFGAIDLALAAYNMGQGALSRALARGDTNDWDILKSNLGTYSAKNRKGLPKETIDYVDKVLNKFVEIG